MCIHHMYGKWCECNMHTYHVHAYNLHTCEHIQSSHAVHACSVCSRCSGCEHIVPLLRGLPYPPGPAPTLCTTCVHTTHAEETHTLGRRRSSKNLCEHIQHLLPVSTQNEHGMHVINMCAHMHTHTHTQYPLPCRASLWKGHKEEGTPCLLPGDKLRHGGSPTEAGCGLGNFLLSIWAAPATDNEVRGHCREGPGASVWATARPQPCHHQGQGGVGGQPQEAP